MALEAVDHSGTPHMESKILQKMLAEENKSANSIVACESHLQPSPKEHIPAEGSTCRAKVTGTETLDNGYLKYGYCLLALCLYFELYSVA